MRSHASFAVLVVLLSSSAVRADSRADEAQIENYRLTMPVVKKMAQVQENVYAAIKKDPSLAAKYDTGVHDVSDESLDSMVKKMDSMPEVREAIAKVGLTTREYLIATLAMFEAGMAGAMQHNQVGNTGRLPAGVRANMKFMEENRAAFAELQKRSQEIEREKKKLTQKKTKEGEEAEEEPPADDGPDKK